MAPPPSTAVSPVVALIVRVLTLVFVLVSVIILATNNVTTDSGIELKFNDSYTYRYMLASGVIGIAYTLLQTAFTIYHASTGNRLGGDGLAIVDFYGDKVISYLLATGAAAGFGLTVDLNVGNVSETDGFLNKANAAASILLIGFVFSAVSSVFSAYSLPKKPLL